MTEYLFKILFVSSVAGSAMGILIKSLETVTKRHFSPLWHYIMWIIAAAITICPVKISLAPAFVPQNFSTIQKSVLILNEQNVANVANTGSAILTHVRILDFVCAIWILGAALLFAAKLISYLVFIRKIHKHSVPCECRQLSQYTSRKVCVRICSFVASPMLTGIFRPTLILPDTQLTPDDMSFVLKHEMMHLKRCDILIKWFVCIIKCINWYNPFIYMISKNVDIYCEISCDTSITGDMSENEKILYMKTILSLICLQNPPMTSAMTSNKEVLKRRFIMIKKSKKLSKKAIIISVITALTVIGVTVLASGMAGKGITGPEMQKTDISAKTPNEETEPKLLPQAEKTQPLTSMEREKESPVLEESIPPANTQAPVSEEKSPSPVLEQISLAWPCESTNISNGFGIRVHPITKETKTHNGVDILSEKGKNVHSAISGTVTQTGFDAEIGNYIVVSSAGVVTKYSALSEITVSEGDKVEQSDVIGKVGNTGKSTGAHLHFEVIINGEPYNPEEILN